jgi:hypothetical protein
MSIVEVVEKLNQPGKAMHERIADLSARPVFD